MKIAPKSAESFLVRPDANARACLLYGPDAGLVRERAGHIKKAILAGSDDPFAFVEMQESNLLEDPARLADELNAISFMGGKKLIMIRSAGDKTTKIIEAVAQYFHADAFVVILADELPTRSTLRGLFEKDSALAALACYKDEIRDVADIVRKSFADAGIPIDRDCVEYLTQQLGNDRYVTRQELEKIITYVGDTKTISLEEVRELVDYNRDTNLDDIVNAVADKSLANIEKTLANMSREGLQPVAYVRALLRYFNRLYKMRADIDSGQRVEAVIQAARPPIFFRQVPILSRHLNLWRQENIVKALKLLTEAELACKTSDIPILAASARKLMQVTRLK